MKKLSYPALFHKAEEGGFWITFPDFPECMTQGENMQDAYEMAWDALGLAVVSRIENREALPPVTEPYAVTLDPDTFCVVVPFELISYQKKHNSKAVKKTLSIPEWLNEAATDRNVNFSQVLQDALLQKLTNKTCCIPCCILQTITSKYKKSKCAKTHFYRFLRIFYKYKSR